MSNGEHRATMHLPLSEAARREIQRRRREEAPSAQLRDPRGINDRGTASPYVTERQPSGRVRQGPEILIEGRAPSRVIQLEPVDIEGRLPRSRRTPQASERTRATGSRLAQSPPQGEPPFWRVPAGQAIRESLQDERTQQVVERANREAERATRERYGVAAARSLREQRRMMNPYDLPRTFQLPWYDRPENLTPQEQEWLRREPLLGNIAGIAVGILRSLDRLFESIEAIPELPRAIWELVRKLSSPEFLLNRRRQGELILSIVMEPFRAIATDIDAGVRAAEEGDQIESSARLIEATVRVLEIIAAIRAAVGTAARIPRSLQRLEAVGERLRQSPRLAELKQLVRDRLAASE